MLEDDQKSSADRTALRRKIRHELATLKSPAISPLEQRGYEILGQNTTQTKANT